MFSLRPPRGPFPVGAVTLVAPVTPATAIGTATLAATNTPALVLDEVTFTAYYPADLEHNGKSSKGLDWLIRPAGATLKGFSRFTGVPTWLLRPIVYLFGIGLKIPAYWNAPLLHPGDACKQWPLVIFSHGLGGSRTAYSQICSEMAAAGKIVLAVEHRDGTGPACTPRAHDGKTRTVLYCREDDVVFPPDRAGTTPRVLPLRVDQLEFRQHEIYRIYAAFCALVRDGVALEAIDGAQVELRSWAPAPGPALVNWDDVTLVGHSFGGCTVLSIVSSAPPPAYAPIPVSKVLLYDPWLEPLPSPGSTPIDPSSASSSFSEPSSSESASLSVLKPTGRPEQMLVINSQAFSLWTVHFTRLAEVVKAWDPQGRRLLTLIGSRHASFSDFPMLPVVRTKQAEKLIELTATLTLAFLDGTLDAALERVPTKKYEEKIIGKRKDGRPKRTLVGAVGDVVVH
ncbi:platelet-activating factor acetylhydrolase, isoform II-domain-containing protein [Mycena haematopus]|nr:platelet-activating factor acetylhydrolase, isoform II-domain-containing protein [Mycena haematopus]